METPGLGRTVTVHPADVMDRDGVTRWLPPHHLKAEFPRLAHVWLDAGDNGNGKGQEWIEPRLHWPTQVGRPPPRRVLVAADVEPAARPGFPVLPRRGVVERTFAWLGPNRRWSTDYERFCETSEALVYAAMSRLMVRRLAAPILLPIKTKGPGTAYTVADSEGGQPCKNASGTPRPKR